MDTQNYQECVTAPRSDDYNNLAATQSDETRSDLPPASGDVTVAAHVDHPSTSPEGSDSSGSTGLTSSLVYNMVGAAVEKVRLRVLLNE